MTFLELSDLNSFNQDQEVLFLILNFDVVVMYLQHSDFGQ